MPLRFSPRALFTAFLVVVPVATLFVVLVVRNASASTFAACVVLLVAVAAVTLKSAVDAGPTPSVGQLLYETEHPIPVGRGGYREATRARRW
jgi:hypothetical protein